MCVEALEGFQPDFYNKTRMDGNKENEFLDINSL